jgi:hypothetical protein
MNSKHTWLWAVPTALSVLISLGCEPAPLGDGRSLARQTAKFAVGGAPSKAPSGGVSNDLPAEPVLWEPVAELTQQGIRPDLALDQVLGLVPAAGTCPPADGHAWAGGALFGKEAVPPEPPLVGKFCAYRRLKPDASIDKLPRYCPFASATQACTGAAPERWLEPAPKGVVALGLGESASLQVAKAMRTRFGKLMGVLGTPPASAPSSVGPAGALPIKRTVWTLDNGGEHAKAVQQTILDTACPSAPALPCPLEIKTSDVFGSDAASASALDLIERLFEATQSSLAAKKQGTVFVAALGVHLANMREPPRNGVVPARGYLAYEALKAAINYTACSDYLFVAAIGNRDGGPGEDDVSQENPMFPGGWADEQRAWACTTNKPVDDRPIVLAAGAIDGDSSDSLTTRVNGQAEFVTPGYAVPLDPQARGRLYWEGSSFSAAALAGVVASAWSYMPGASGPEVLATLRAASKPIAADRFTHLCHSGEKCPVRRVQACDTVRTALLNTASKFNDAKVQAMANSLLCAPAQPSPFTKVGLDPVSRAAIVNGGTRLSWSTTDASPSNEECGAPASVAKELGRAPYSCPFEYFGNGQENRDLEPAPPTNGCPHCVIIIPDPRRIDLIAGIDRNILPVISSPVLRVRHLTNVIGTAGNKGGIAVGGGIAPGTGDAVDSDQYYELSGLLDTEGEVHIILNAQVGDNTRALEVMLEYVVGDGDQEQAQGVPLPVIDLR